MNFRDLLKLVASNLKRMKGRVIMTALGVVIGTAAVMVLVSLGAGLQRQATESFGGGGSLNDLRVSAPMMEGDMGMAVPRAVGPGGTGGSSRRAPDQPTLDDETLAMFREIPGVELVTPMEPLQMGAELQYGKLRGWAQIIGVEPDYLQKLEVETASGDLMLGRGQVVVGGRVPESFYDPEAMEQGRGIVIGGPGGMGQSQTDLQDARLTTRLQRFGEDGTMSEKTVRMYVTGVLAPVGWRHDYTVYAALRDVIEYNSWARGRRLDPGREGYNEVLVRADSSKSALDIEQTILDMGFRVQSERAQLEQATSFFVTLQAILGGIGAIALLVAAFGIANTMLMAILERTREIGLMKAIGASNKDVMIVFLGESGGIGLLGGLGGVALGLALNTVLNLIARSMQLGSAVTGMGMGAEAASITHTPLWLPIFGVIFATLIGLASGAYPASRAAGLSPISALKYE